MMTMRSKWWALPRAAARVASSCFPASDFVTCCPADWLGAGVMLCVGADSGQAHNAKQQTSNTWNRLRQIATGSERLKLIIPFCNTMKEGTIQEKGVIRLSVSTIVEG